MATSSFSRAFVVDDADAIAKLKLELVSTQRPPRKADRIRDDVEHGLALMKQRLKTTSDSVYDEAKDC
jgi:hypothetical protein